MSENKRVILITGDGKKWYEQAIFIVRKDCLQNEMPNDFISEAERIVNGYMTKMVPAAEINSFASSNGIKTKANMRNNTKMANVQRGRANINFILNLLVFICCIALLALFCMIYII